MKLTHALATGAAGLSMAAAGLAVGATPAQAAPHRTSTYGLSCTYNLDEVAGTLAGSCVGRTPLGTATATFSGTWSGDSAAGTIAVDTWFGDFGGTFSGSGWSTGSATGSYTLTTPFGPLAGTFSATGS
ncbi:hypothetical protein GCM10011584_28350 [Nocardioides phosphati]|uniref:Uncharacterized protein n=1 Tax=Nocardioides phosphati TaxID=1867775 RepID=A0ABQ2NDV7_9ACTN|nr:hypothetical protein [Nocardioides phosphati]GGO92291.1 hypothetical protein GCM10011584_28350 [Nocardioides phosphati]